MYDDEVAVENPKCSLCGTSMICTDVICGAVREVDELVWECPKCR